MKRSFVWMMAAILVCGSTVLSSCNGDDKFSSDVRIGVEPGFQETINSIMQNVKTDMEAADFKDLAPLAEALKNCTAKVSCTGTDSTGVQEIIASLQTLLDSFFDSENPATFGWSRNFSNLLKTLQMAVNVSMAFEKNVDNKYVGERNYSHSFDIVVNDTLTYNIAFGTEKNTGVSLEGIDNAVHRRLIIDRNGTTVLTINTNKDFDANVKGNSINTTQLSMGSLDYKGMKFSLVRTQHNIDSVASNLVYSKGDSKVVDISLKGENDLTLEKLLHHNAVFKGELEASISDGMLGLKSNIDNMNKFYMAGLGLAEIGIAGGSKEKCQEVTDAFNSVVNSKLLLFGSEFGLVTFKPLASDSVPDIYRPELILRQLPIDENSGELVLKDFLAMMGLSFEDIINMLLGKDNE